MPRMPEDWVFDKLVKEHFPPGEKRGFITVTTVIREAGFMTFRSPDESAMQRGTDVHDAILAKLTGDPQSMVIREVLKNPDTAGHYRAFGKFMEDSMFEPIEFEEKRYNLPHRCAGKPDLFGRIKGKLAVIDTKTGTSFAWHKLQTAGYADMFEDHAPFDGIARYGLYLKRNGTYKLIPHLSPQDLEVFRAAVLSVRWKRLHMKSHDPRTYVALD